MKFVLKNSKNNDIDNINYIDYGVPFIAKTKDCCEIEFIALKIHDVDGEDAVLDLKSGEYYKDIYNYKVCKIIEGKFLEC